MGIVQRLSSRERLLWFSSLALITGVFLVFSKRDLLPWIASIVGVTSLIFCAKAEPIGQALMIVFSMIYGVISLRCAYYGEMFTYVGMTLPMACISLISWLCHPYEKGKTEVKIEKLNGRKIFVLIGTALMITGAFYFILKTLHTANLFWSTISVFTSFVAVLLTFWRSPYYALGYAANDIVLIVLWLLQQDMVMVLCFMVFLINDFYGFCNWKQMEKKQQEEMVCLER